MQLLARDKRSSLLSKKFERRCGKTLFVLEKFVIYLRTQEVIKSFTQSQKQTKLCIDAILTHIHTQNIQTQLYINNYIYTVKYIFIYLYICVCVCVNIYNTYTQTHMQAYTHRVYIYVCVCVRACGVCVCVYQNNTIVYIHVYKYTHV